jgi:hypothetical protein
MANSPAPPLNRSSPWRALFWIGLTLSLPCLALGGIIFGVASYFRLSSDTRALREGLIKASGVEWRQQLGLNIGGFTFGAARAGLAFVPLDPEARAALSTVRGAEVGLYQMTSGRTQPDSAAMLIIADQVLSDRGWERVVGVLHEEQLVGVYLPANSISAGHVKSCVMVFDGRQMVLVRANANLEPLLDFVRSQTDVSQKLTALAARRETSQPFGSQPSPQVP